MDQWLNYRLNFLLTVGGPVMPTTITVPNFLSMQRLDVINWMIDEHIIYPARDCTTCGSPMSKQRFQMMWRCTHDQCRFSQTLLVGSFFSGLKMPLNRSLHVCYMWCMDAHSKTIQGYLKMSPKTVSAMQGYCRQLVADALDHEDLRIGGPGVIVELDETKIGKPKNNRGRAVEGFWAVGGIERSDERRAFVVEVEDRTTETLMRIVQTYVRQGSIVHTDCWAGYHALGQNSHYTHFSVNHSRNFVDPETGVHTNTIEGFWSGLKSEIPARARTREVVKLHLYVHLWRRLNRKREWESLLPLFLRFTTTSQ
jgi:hypothetical protein